MKHAKNYTHKDVYKTQQFLEVVQLRFANQTGVFLTTSQLFTLLRIIFYTIFELTAEKPLFFKFIGTFERFQSKWKHPKTGNVPRETIKFRIGERAKQIINGLHYEYSKNTFFKNEELKPLEYYVEVKKLEKEKKSIEKRLAKFKNGTALLKEKDKVLEKMYRPVKGKIIKESILTKQEFINTDFDDLDSI